MFKYIWSDNKGNWYSHMLAFSCSTNGAPVMESLCGNFYSVPWSLYGVVTNKHCPKCEKAYREIPESVKE